MSSRHCLFLLSGLLLSTLAAAHGAHQHGVAHIDVAIDSNGVEWSLTADGHGILGFEHSPVDAAETAQVAHVTDTLRAGLSLVAVPAAAECMLETAQVQSPYDAGTVEGEHADWTASYRLNCRRVADIGELDVSGFFAAFPSVQTVKLQLVTAQAQTGADLTPANPRIAVSEQ